MDDPILPIISGQRPDPPPFKKRKIFRRRFQAQNDGNDNNITVTPQGPSAPAALTLEELIAQGSGDVECDLRDEQEEPLSVAEILRQRRATQRRKGGIEFRNHDTSSKNEASDAQAMNPLLDEDETLNRIITVVDRFAPQTGQVADVDQHMYAKSSFYLLLYRCRC